MRIIGRWGRVFSIFAIALVAGGGAVQVGAPTARAECEGRIAFDALVREARGAVVGRVTASQTDASGFTTVTALRVEHAFGMRVGRTYRGTILAANPCTDDGGRVGDRVVVLVDVPSQVAPRTRIDLYFTIGQSVTPWEAGSIGNALPDTATALGPAGRLDGTQPGPLVLPSLVGLVALGAMLRSGTGSRRPRVTARGTPPRGR